MANSLRDKLRRPGFGCAVGGLLVGLALLIAPGRLLAFDLQTRWSRTAMSGPGLQVGDPTTVTWGFVADGTAIVGDEGDSPSLLVAMFDGIYTAGGSGSDLTNREWFALFEQSFDRWSQLSGLTYIYEPNDPGDPIDNTTGPQGLVGLVPDVRIGAHFIGSTSGTNTLAYTYFPNHSDLVLDSEDVAWFADRDNNSLALRNLIMHEVGHGLGINHISMPQRALMDKQITTAFDGPQLDDILAVQRLYGDALEKYGGNDSFNSATPLGQLGSATTLAIGTRGDSPEVAPHETDFVSIDGITDLDYFSFTIPAPAVVSLELIPRGATYLIGGNSFNAQTLSDLSLTLLDLDGTTELGLADSGGVGATEMIDSYYLPQAGTYFARVASSIDQVQLYGLNITAEALFLPGDVNLDGVISAGSGDPATDDVAAFVAGWRSVLATDDPKAAWQKGDLDLNGVSDLHDAFLLRSALQGAGLHFELNQLVPVPEPASLGLAGVGLGLAIAGRRRRRVI